MTTDELNKICFEFWVGALEMECKNFCTERDREKLYKQEEDFNQYFQRVLDEYPHGKLLKFKEYAIETYGE